MTATKTGCLDSFTITQKQYQQICQVVYDHCGINLHEGKKELVRARLAKLLRKYKIDNFDDYLRMVMQDPGSDLFSEMIDQISTNLTSFFREPKHFEFLQTVFLPDLIKRKQQEGKSRIRAWSAGCSSGEEPYSLAITLLEAVRDKGIRDVRILATDISTRILKIAQTGRYEADRVAGLAPALKNRYLIRKHTGPGQDAYEVRQELRNLITFKYLNLMEPWPFHGPLDFIFCRNVMIYFNKPTQETLVNRFWDMLDKNGVFFTGHSESLTGIRHRFSYVQPTIYRKT